MTDLHREDVSGTESWQFTAAGQPTHATRYRASGTAEPGNRAGGTTLVMAPGAGAGQHHPFMVSLSRSLTTHGIDVVTFDFPYTAAGRRRPDRPDVLEAAWRDAIATVRAHAAADGTVFIGGKSMGGRLATHVASSGGSLGVAGVVCVGYPLHPPHRQSARSVSHFETIDVPVLILQGTRDAFGGPDDVRNAVGGRARVAVVAVDDADHSFAVPRKTGRSAAHVIHDLARTTAEWIARNREGPA